MKTLLLLALTLTIAPALAGTEGQEVILFEGKGQVADIVSMQPGNAKTSDKAFIFIPTDNCRIAQHYSWNSSGYFHNAHPAPDITPRPDPGEFIDLIANDTTMPPQIYQYIGFIAAIEKSDRRAAVWARVNNNPPAWLTPAVKTAVEGHAAASNLPLK